MNKFQEKLCETYGGGDYAYMADPTIAPRWREASADVGDTLFKYLMIDLADERHDPMTLETAMARLERAVNDVEEVSRAFTKARGELT